MAAQPEERLEWFKVSRFCYMLMKCSCDRRRCQKNQENPGPGPREGQHCEPCVRWLAEERSLRLRRSPSSFLQCSRPEEGLHLTLFVNEPHGATALATSAGALLEHEAATLIPPPPRFFLAGSLVGVSGGASPASLRRLLHAFVRFLGHFMIYGIDV